MPVEREVKDIEALIDAAEDRHFCMGFPQAQSWRLRRQQPQ
jgi:hypothetical protein